MSPARHIIVRLVIMLISGSELLVPDVDGK